MSIKVFLNTLNALRFRSPKLLFCFILSFDRKHRHLVCFLSKFIIYNTHLRFNDF